MAQQFFNLAEVMGQVDLSRAREQQMRGNEFDMKRQQREMERQAQQDADLEAQNGALRDSFETVDGKTSFNNQKAIQLLAQKSPQMAYKLQQEMETNQLNAGKLKNENAKSDLSMKVEKAKYYRDVLASATPETYASIMQQAQQDGMAFAANAPQQYDPNFIKQNVMTADKFLEGQKPQEYNAGVNYDEKGRAFVTDKFGAIKYLGTSKMPDAPKSPTLPSGYEVNPNGGLMPIKGGPADPSTKASQETKLTETMRNAGMYAARMTAAEELIGGIGVDSQKPSVLEKIAGVGGETAANYSRSDTRQQALQAQRDWVRAKLRKESGAAIGVDEMKNEIATYFPQLGDSEAVIEQKKQARMLATDELTKSAGGAYTYETPNKADGNILAKDAKMQTNAYKSKAPPAKYPKARQAPDGNWYIPKAGGGYQMVTK